MDAPGTVFYLVPKNKYAAQIADDPANRDRICSAPHIDRKPVLRIGLDQQLKSPPYLARFGRHKRNDVILGHHFSRNDQCYFNFNKDTGELLLHDLSEKKDTELYDIAYITNKEGKVVKEEFGLPQIWKDTRQCVVLLAYDSYNKRNREWIFQMHDAVFRLIPRRTRSQDEAAFAEERIAFAGQPDPDRTFEGTMQRLITLGLQSLQSEALTTTYMPPSTVNTHNTRFQTPLEPTEDKVIRYTKLRPLGRGGQGDVHKVVDMYNGNHHACKIVAVKAEVPNLNIYSEKDFRAKIEMEVNLVQQLKHDHIVPYKHYQGFKSQNIEIFMPIYEGSLHDLIKQYRPKRPEDQQEERHRPDGSEVAPQAVRDMTDRMLSQILDALDYVHTNNPQIIHRDIKPANILYQGDRFLLTDFGIAKVVDTSRTMIGTKWYAAPEVVRQDGEQTPKVDMYSLGVTVLECLVELPNEGERRVIWDWRQWYQELQTLLNQHESRYTPMLADAADQRPSARELLDLFFPRPTRVPPQNPETNIAWTSFGVSPNQANGTTTIYSAPPTPMDWTHTVATAILPGVPQPTQWNESTPPLQPNPLAAPTPKAPPKRPAQLGVRRVRSAKSAKSANERQKGHKRNGSSQNDCHAPSQPAGVQKRSSSGRTRQSRPRSINKAQEIRAWGTARPDV